RRPSADVMVRRPYECSVETATGLPAIRRPSSSAIDLLKATKRVEQPLGMWSTAFSIVVDLPLPATALTTVWPVPEATLSKTASWYLLQLRMVWGSPFPEV